MGEPTFPGGPAGWAAGLHWWSTSPRPRAPLTPDHQTTRPPDRQTSRGGHSTGFHRPPRAAVLGRRPALPGHTQTRHRARAAWRYLRSAEMAPTWCSPGRNLVDQPRGLQTPDSPGARWIPSRARAAPSAFRPKATSAGTGPSRVSRLPPDRNPTGAPGSSAVARSPSFAARAAWAPPPGMIEFGGCKCSPNNQQERCSSQHRRTRPPPRTDTDGARSPTYSGTHASGVDARDRCGSPGGRVACVQ